MDQLTMLWEYQLEDMKADKMANDIRRSPLRQKMENDRNLFMERQKQYKQIEEQVAVMTDRKDGIRDAIARCEEQIAAITQKFEQNPPEDEEAAHAMLVEASKYRDNIASYEQEMRRMVKDSSDYDQKQRSCRHEAAKVKVEFDQLKINYDKEIGEKKAALDAQRAVAAAKAVGIDAKLMEEYNTIKKRIMPPMARLVGNQCSGCNTAQPSSLLSKIKSGTELIECETCGRMIIP